MTSSVSILVTTPAPEEAARPPDEGTGFVPAYLPQLDVIRGVAIVVVALHHLEPQLFDFGWVGVDLFFVLSGFLITRILLASRQDPHYYRNFYIRRSLRIFPLYYAVLIALWAYQTYWATEVICERSLWLWFYATSFITLATKAGTLHERENSLAPFTHFWSLSVEEHFYLVWPLAVRHVDRLLRFCLVLMVLACLCRTAMHLLHFHYVSIYKFTLARMDTLVIGAAIALLERRSHGLRGKPLRIAAWMLPACIIGVVLVCMFDGRFHRRGLLMQVVGYTILPLLAGSMIVLASVAQARGPFRFLTHNRLLLMLGRYSYGIYVLHRPLIPIIAAAIPSATITGWVGSNRLGHALYTGLNFTLFVVVAALSYHLLEKPFLSLKGRFATTRPKVTIPAEAK
jgi:peptidoglycan/LPS O-acetylase OafA/YrhL